MKHFKLMLLALTGLGLVGVAPLAVADLDISKVQYYAGVFVSELNCTPIKAKIKPNGKILSAGCNEGQYKGGFVMHFDRSEGGSLALKQGKASCKWLMTYSSKKSSPVKIKLDNYSRAVCKYRSKGSLGLPTFSLKKQ